MIPVFQGAESIRHLEKLLEVHAEFFAADEAPHMAVSTSFIGLERRRLGVSYLEKVVERVPVVLDAGILHMPIEYDSILEMQDRYYRMVKESPVHYAVQFAHTSLRPEDRVLPDDDRIIPFLFEPNDAHKLEEVLSSRGEVAMVYKGDRRVPALLRRSATGIALSIDLPDLEAANAAGFNASYIGPWINPGKYGEIHVWDGKKFHRHDANRREFALEKYESVFERLNADMDLVRAFDSGELQRVSAYSYLLWADSLAARVVSDTTEAPASVKAVSEDSVSAITISEGENSDRPKMALPVFSQEFKEVTEYDDDGFPYIRRKPVMRAVTESVRVCDTCFLAVTCPAFSKGASCQFNFPVEVRDDEQVRAVLHSMVELQAARVAFARFAEEVNGGMPDPQVGKEMDRLLKITEKVLKPVEKKGKISFTVEAESSGGSEDDDTVINAPMVTAGGVLSKIFGTRTASRQIEAADSDASDNSD